MSRSKSTDASFAAILAMTWMAGASAGHDGDEGSSMRRLIRIIRNLALLADRGDRGSRRRAAVQRRSRTARGRFRWPRCRASAVDTRPPRRGSARRSASAPFRVTKSPTSTPTRCAACGRISRRAFRRFMPRRGAKSSPVTACSTPGRARDPKAAPIALAGASGRGAGGAGHREGLAATAVRRRHCRRLHLGPRLLGRQGQPLFDAGGRRGDGQGRVQAEADDLFCVRP